MVKAKWLAGLMALGLLISLFSSLPALAQSENEQQYLKQAGPYNFTTVISSALIKTETAVPVTVRLENANGQPLTANGLKLTASVDPAPGLSATPTKLELTPVEGAAQPTWQGHLNLAISGDWAINLTAEGAAGPASVTVPIVVAPPPAMPTWLAWLIGLSPVVWFGLFFGLMGRQAGRKLRAELAPAH